MSKGSNCLSPVQLPALHSRWCLGVPKPMCCVTPQKLCKTLLHSITKFQRSQALGTGKCPPKCMSFPGPQNVTSLRNRVFADVIN